MADRILKYQPNIDVPNTSVLDILPDDQVKVWVYGMPNAAKGKFKIGDGTLTIVSITQDGLIGLNNDGSIDVIIDQNLTTVFDTADGAEDIGKRVRVEKSLNLMTNQWVQHPYEMTGLSSNSIIPLCITIGEPFDETKYENGEQTVFLVSDYSAISEYKAGALGIDPEGTYNISLMNVSTLETQYKYAKVKFVTGIFETNIGSDENNLVLTVPNTSLIHKINMKGKLSKGTSQDDEITQISLKTDGKKLLPFKGTPVSLSHGLELSADWFDYDSVLPWFIAKQFLTPKPLSELKNVLKQGTQETFGDKEIETIIDMLAIATGYGNTWKDIARANGNESGWDGAKQQIGKIYPNTTVGSTKISASDKSGFSIPGLEGQDPIKAIDGVYETYLRSNYGKEGTLEAKVMKQIICALSRFIYSSYAIGKGQNAFNQMFLPWYLEPQSALSLSAGNPNGNGYTQEKNYVLSKATTFQLRSRYFDLKSLTNIEKDFNISDIKLVQSDRKMTLPTVPLQLQEQTKLPLPGDIATNSSTDLQFMWYIPTTKNGEGIYINQLSTTQSTGTKTETLNNYITDFVPSTISSKVQGNDNERKLFIQNDILSKYSNIGICKNLTDPTQPCADIVYDYSTISFPSQVSARTYNFTFDYVTNTSSNATTRLEESLIITSVETGKSAKFDGISLRNDVTRTLTRDEKIQVLNLTQPSSTKNNLNPDEITIQYSYQSFQPVNDRAMLKVNDITSVEQTIKNVANVAKRFTLRFNETMEKIQIPNLQILNFPDIKYGIERNSIFSKVSFEEEIATIMTWESTDLKLSELKGRNISDISTMTFTIVFDEKIQLKVKNKIIEIKSLFSKDESIAQQTIVFS